MREFRTGYFAAPCLADRRDKPGYVQRRVNVTMPPSSARTGKAMLNPFSDLPAHAANLRRVRGVNVNHGQPRGFGLVGSEILELSECPAMQSSPDALPGLNAGSYVGQVFHANFASADAQSFRNDGFAGFVVDVLDMPLLATGDSFELAFSSSATVGLETTAMGKVFVAVVPQLSAAPDLAGAGGCEVILANVYPENATAGDRRSIRKIEDEVEIPDTFANNEFRVFGRATCKQIQLVLATDKRNLDTPGQSKQRKRVVLDRVGAFVEVYRRGTEGNYRDRIIPGNALVCLERLVGIGDTVDSLANHLTTKHGELLAHWVIRQVVQRNTIPAPMFLGERNDGITRLGIGIRKRRQCRRLFWRSEQFKVDSSLHIG